MTAGPADRGLLRYRIDWLEMLHPPETGPVSCPAGECAELVEAVDFPVWYFFAMYDAVGDGYFWDEMHLADPPAVEKFLGSADTRMHTLLRHGWPQGFFLLDFRAKGVCDIAYFGLVRQAIGKGLGGWMLDRAVSSGWAMPGVRRLTVNTCTLDHPRAMALYKGRGFELIRSENRSPAAPKPARRTDLKGHIMLNSLAPQPEDKIIKLIQDFKDDPRGKKIDLGLGVYRDRSGATPVMRAVKRAEKLLWETEQTKSYTGLAGDPGFRDAMISLTLGECAPEGRVASVHTPGGTGAVRQGLELVKFAAPEAAVWISDPSWPNHPAITRHMALRLRTYRYFDPAARAVDFEGMMQDLTEAKSGDVLILHGCCHNPTGADLSPPQWDTVIEMMRRTGILPLVDIAYQGFGEGVEEDAAAARRIASELPEALIAASCSKNFGIYRERTGVLMTIAETPKASGLAQQTLAYLNRLNFSFPPDHGARLVTMILADEGLRAEWAQELEEIRTGMLNLRRQLAGELRRLSGSDRFGFLAAHRGMFSLLGADADQVMNMRRDAGIYMVADGRINVAGLNEDSVPVLAKAMLDAGL